MGVEMASTSSVLKLSVRDQFWMNIPAVSGWNIYSHFSDEAMESVKVAVAKLIDLHPMLAGQIERRDPTDEEVGDSSLLCPEKGSVVEIHSGKLSFEDVFQSIDCTKFESKDLFKALDASRVGDAQKAAREELEPIVQQHSLKPPAADECQALFLVVVGKLPNDRAFIIIQVAHVIGDGASYYRINEAINNIIQEKDVPAMEFKVADEHIANSAHKSVQDKHRTLLGWLPASIEAVNHRKQAITSLTVNKEALAVAKDSLAQEAGVPFLSSNDVLMASFAEIFKQHEVMNFLCDMRGRDPCAEAKHIGVYARTIMFPTACLSKDPSFLRKDILGNDAKIKFDYYGTDEFPDLSKDLFGSVTNWASLTKYVYPTGAHLDLHLPNSAFLKGFGLDVITVWNPTDDTMSIMTNMCEETLAQNAEKSKLFKTIFDL